MEKYVKMVLDKCKAEKLFAPQGGPIILAQVCNELPYGYIYVLMYTSYFDYQLNPLITSVSYNADWEWVQRYPARL